MEENVEKTVKSVSERIREAFDKNGAAGMEDAISFSAADALMIFSCFQKMTIINEITLALFRKIEGASTKDIELFRHEATEFQERAERFMVSALDKYMEK